MKKYTVLYFFFSFSLMGMAQGNLDSLWSVWNDTTDLPLERSNALYNIIWDQYMFSQPDSATYYSAVCLKFSEENVDSNMVAFALNAYGISFAVRGNLDSAIYRLEQALAIQTGLNHPQDVAGLTANLGGMYADRGDLTTSLEMHTRSYQTAEQLGDSTLMAINLNNIGVAYIELGEPGLAIDNLFKALSLREALKDHEGMAAAYSEIADVQESIGEYDQAYKNAMKAKVIFETENIQYKLATVYVLLSKVATFRGQKDSTLYWLNSALEVERSINSTKGIAAAMHSLGEFYMEEGDYSKADELLQTGLQLNDSAGYKVQLMHSLSALGKLNSLEGNTSSALKYYLWALELAQLEGIDEVVVNAANGLYEAYKKQGDYSQALQMHELASETLQKLKSEAAKKSIIKNQLRYDYEKQALSDSLAFAKSAAIQEAQIQSEKQTKYFLIIGLILLAALGGLLFQRFRVAKSQKEALNAAHEKLKEMDEAKSIFFTNVSHELRTPLTVIDGMAEQIEKNPARYADQGISLIKRNSKSLLRLINQILDLRKLEVGKLKVQNINGDVIPYVKYLFESFSSLAESKGINLEIASEVESLQMDYDPNNLQIILGNLFSNGIKYNRVDGTLTLGLTQQNGTLSLTVSDTGEGIAGPELENIFIRFYQVEEAAVRNPNSSGVGLALTKEVVELMDGSIAVESEVGVGTSFKVEIPVLNELEGTLTSELENKAEIQINANEKEHLLIVEDNADVAAYLTTVLEDTYNLTIARDGGAGIRMAQELVPDIIISDVMMPVKDGYEVVKTLKNDERSSHIPIIMLTAMADVDSRIKGLERGADAYLAKPFEQAELNLILTNLIDLKKKNQERYRDFAKIETVEDSVTNIEDAFIQKVQNALESHLDNSEYGITDLCKSVGVSRTQMHNKLKAITGYSTTAYVTNYRVNKAKELLGRPDLNISEIAYMVGFKTPHYFSKKFKETVGISPNEYRENGN